MNSGSLREQSIGMIQTLWRQRELRARRDPFVEYYEAVFAYAVRRLASRDLAEEVAAETLAAAAKAKVPEGDELPWLYGIAGRKIADTLRRRRLTFPLIEGISHRDGLHQELAQTEDAKAIRNLVDGLPQDQREAILLFYVEDLSATQIAQSMGRSEASVYSLLQGKGRVHRRSSDQQPSHGSVKTWFPSREMRRRGSLFVLISRCVGATTDHR